MTATLTPNALNVLEKRYLQRGESPQQLFRRVANAVAQGDNPFDQHLWADKFYTMLSDLKFLPNSPTLVNAGTNRGCLSGCFVMSPEDNMPNILQVGYDAGLIEKWGGGIGFGFSKLRPRGDSISTTHGQALGVLGTLRIYSTIGHEITQGSFRMGAHMGQLIVSHPQIQEFIHCKEDESTAQNFNLSVQVTDEFMRAVKADALFRLVSPRDGAVWRTVKARSLWEEICEAAWRSGDPGIMFIDRVWDTAPNPQLGAIQAQNPCGEESLENYASCNLGSVNLMAHVKDGKVKWGDLISTIRLATRFLNDVIEVNVFPPEVPKLYETNQSTRRIGLGVMGWADLLLALKIPYDSEDAVVLACSISQLVTEEAWKESGLLAKERGAYPEWENSAIRERIPFPVRNSSVTTIAPTGSISVIAGCSSGIEPHYALAHVRKALWKADNSNTEMLEAIPQLESDLESAGCDSVKIHDILQLLVGWPQMAEQLLTPLGIDASIYKSAHTVSAEWHVKHQVAWQKYVTNGVSKTINLPFDATPQDVSEVYTRAWEGGCKGTTIYRNGSKREQVLTTGTFTNNGCPECGNDVDFEEGCVKCGVCGWGLCGV